MSVQSSCDLTIETLAEWPRPAGAPPADPRTPDATVRSVTFADLNALSPLFDEYRRFFMGTSDVHHSRRFLGQRLARADSRIFAAFQDGLAVGFVQAYPLFSALATERVWYLSDLYVASSHRRRGIGRQLAQACIDFSRETAARGVLFQVPSSEHHLARFYADLGFAKDGTFELYSCDIGS
jgi:ribosomal protein S18 acetylase RimI-like enzyme